MGWKIVEIEEGQQLNLFLDNLVVLRNNDRIIIPINDIDVLLINNPKLKITIQLLNRLTDKNVLTIICDNKYLPQSLCLPIIGNYNTLKIFEKQLAWNMQFKANLWQKIITQKIQNQADFVRYMIEDNEVANQISVMSKQVRAYDVTNREGHASKLYWHAVYGLEFRRHDDDYTNTLLNYGYTILRGYFVRSILKKGLDPRIALFHKSFHNHFALASDLMEPFRCLVDIIVYKLIINKIENFYVAKQKIIEFFNCRIKIDNKEQYLNNAIDKYIDNIVNESTEIHLEFTDLYTYELN